MVLFFLVLILDITSRVPLPRRRKRTAVVNPLVQLQNQFGQPLRIVEFALLVDPPGNLDLFRQVRCRVHACLGTNAATGLKVSQFRQKQSRKNTAITRSRVDQDLVPDSTNIVDDDMARNHQLVSLVAVVSEGQSVVVEPLGSEDDRVSFPQRRNLLFERLARIETAMHEKMIRVLNQPRHIGKKRLVLGWHLLQELGSVSGVVGIHSAPAQVAQPLPPVDSAACLRARRPRVKTSQCADWVYGQKEGQSRREKTYRSTAGFDAPNDRNS